MNVSANVSAILAVVTAILAFAFAYGLSSWIVKADEGDEGMKELSGFIRESAAAFVKRGCMVMIPVILVFFAILGFVINWNSAAFYAAGAIFSALAGFFGIWAAAKGCTRTIGAAVNGGMNPALKIAVRSGAVMGLSAAGFVLLGIGGVFVVSGNQTTASAAAFGFGASTAALFGCAAAGIFKKAADTGAERVAKNRPKLSEGDLRNPVAMAAYAGEYAGNAAGTGLDLFGSYAGSMAAAIAVAAAAQAINPVFGYPFDLPAATGTAFPLLISAAGIAAAIAGIMLAGGNVSSDPAKAIHAGKYLSNGIVAVFSLILSWVFFGNFNCAVSILAGMLTVAFTGRMTHTYTFGTSRRLKRMAERSQNTHLMMGEYGLGMLSTLRPVLLLAACVLTADAFAGFYGITLAAAGMLSTTGMTAAINAYGTVSGNAGKVARTARVSGEAGAIAGKLDSAGKANTAAGKGFTAGAAVLTAAALFAAYSTVTGLKTVDLLEPAVIAGLLAGAMLPVLLSAMAMNSAAKTAYKVIEDVKRQFDSDAGILNGTSRPDYAACADAGAKAALKGILVPGLLAFFAPLTAGILLGPEALGGLLAGSLASGMLTSLILTNTGGPWNHSDEYPAGDPFKDAAGSSVNVFMKLTAVTAVVFAPVFVSIGGLL